MSPDTPVVLDACTLVPGMLCDLLLKLAEHPHLYVPKWSDVILEEVERNQIRLGLPAARARSWQIAVANAFPGSLVIGYDALLSGCHNSPKDRHVLASAIMANAPIIATFNLRDFPPSALAPKGIVAVHPSAFLLELYDQSSQVVVSKLREMASRGRTLEYVLRRLRLVVPTFAIEVASDLGTTLG